VNLTERELHGSRGEMVDLKGEKYSRGARIVFGRRMVKELEE